MTIDVVGHQWWWEVALPGHDAPSPRTRSTSRPGRACEVVGTTADVIHSFWVPELNRKIDLIPGRHEPAAARRRPARALPRAVRRVLRPAARAHGRRSWSRSRRRASAPGCAQRSSARRARPAGERRALLRRAVVRGLPHDPRHRRARHGRARPDALRARAHDRCRARSRTRPTTCATGSRPAARQARQPDAERAR